MYRGAAYGISAHPNQRFQEEFIMNKDQVKGRAEKTKGKIKEIVGKAVGNKEMEVEGKVQGIAGKTQAEYGDLKQDIKKATD
jgi:uncharacterized protein YjbJ (UPF0337 family)